MIPKSNPERQLSQQKQIDIIIFIIIKKNINNV